jgi:dual specificity protein kinase YAK1
MEQPSYGPTPSMFGQDPYYPYSPTDQFAGAKNGNAQTITRQQSMAYARRVDASSIPKIRKIKSIQDLQPQINSQPPYRRANPEGGFISVRETTINSLGSD